MGCFHKTGHATWIRRLFLRKRPQGTQETVLTGKKRSAPAREKKRIPQPGRLLAGRHAGGHQPSRAEETGNAAR